MTAHNPDTDAPDPIDKISESLPQVHSLPPEVLEQLRQEIKKEILADLTDDKAKSDKLKELEAEKYREVYDTYAKTLMASNFPWLNIQGLVDSEDGLKTIVDWNDQMISFLRAGGLTGTTEEEVVGRYLVAMLAELSSSMLPDSEEPGESEYE